MRALTIVAALAFTFSLALTSHGAEAIRIGEINHYKRLPAFALPYKNGIELARDEINAQGGVLGRPLAFIFRDDQGQPGEAVKIAEELHADGVAMITGTIFSHVGLALAAHAQRRGYVYLAAEPLADALVWSKGNRHTFRLRASTSMQAAMLAEEAAKHPARRYATIAPNYAYGQDAVAAFKKALLALRPDVEFVATQWPALFKINAAAEVQALEAARPDAIYNVTFGPDLAKFVREGSLRNLFEDRLMLGLLTGEPEYLDPLAEEAPTGWIVTGYPWDSITEAQHQDFIERYTRRFETHPRMGSLVGYITVHSIAAAIRRAGSTDAPALIEAFRGLDLDTPVGPIRYRSQDHQSTMGAYVGRLELKDGRGVMVNWVYKDGADYLPSDAEVRALRPH